MARPSGYVPPGQEPTPPAFNLATALPTAPAAPSAPAAPAAPTPTAYVVLENMLTPATLADPVELKECIEDIKAECERFGTLVSFHVPTAADLRGQPESEVGNAHAVYAEVAAASHAFAELDGREFDGNRVRVTYR